MTMSFVQSAESAVKPGTTCSKVNAKIKIGGDTYICTKNPTVKNAKLTWVWSGCIQSNTLYADAKKRLAVILDKATAANLAIESDIKKIKDSASSDEASAKIFDQKAADARAKQSNALTEAKSATEKASAAGLNTPTGLNYSKAATQWTKAANSYSLAASNFERSASNLRKKIGEVATLERQKTVVQRSVDNANAEVSSTFENRKSACQPGL